MSHRAALLLFAFVPACGESPTLPVDESVVQFVETSALLNAQPPQVMLSLPEFGAQLFSSRFGPETPCMPSTDPPRGPCYPSLAIGFAHRGRIGWLTVQPDAELGERFEFRGGDGELFGPELAAAWRAADWGSYATVFTPALIQASATPRPTLLRIATELRDWISTHNAHLLLQRDDARTDVEILEILATLPVFQGDAYGHTREVAQGLLEQLGVTAR